MPRYNPLIYRDIRRQRESTARQYVVTMCIMPLAYPQDYDYGLLKCKFCKKHIQSKICRGSVYINLDFLLKTMLNINIRKRRKRNPGKVIRDPIEICAIKKGKTCTNYYFFSCCFSVSWHLSFFYPLH